jgi:hypothetical protein
VRAAEREENDPPRQRAEQAESDGSIKLKSAPPVTLFSRAFSALRGSEEKPARSDKFSCGGSATTIHVNTYTTRSTP